MDKFEELFAKLEELFELDKADLDFGIHRIIKQKHVQIKEYLHKRLPEKVKKVIGEVIQDKSQIKLHEIRRKCEDAFGFEAFEQGDKLIDIYENTPLGKQYTNAMQQYREAKDIRRNETQVYSHLCEFFSRYYDHGDFLSLRRTSSRHKYSVPYNGEEVLLHWANKDQYYIKSSETLNDYTFTLKENTRELRVKFKLTKTDAVQDNNKAARAFVIDEEKEIEETADAIIIPFHFKEFPRKPTEKHTVENLEKVLEAKLPDVWKERLWEEDLTFTGKDSRTILRKHLVSYTKKNTSDFFIHKNIGGFLRNELDFYIKNEVMYLDDVDDRPAEYLEKVIRKIKAIRIIAKDLIAFLAQFEDFQKKLWLKKKFVIETNYCITLDRIPEELYPEIVANNRQQEEWVRLFAIDEIEEEIGQPGYSSPLSVEFLKTNPYLVLDTVFFDEDFKYKILSAIDDFDEQCDGLLIHSENFQALNLLQEKYHEKIKCIYIDPPYNTDASSIIYKNDYKNSSWLSLMENRLTASKTLLTDTGIVCVAIDDEEVTGVRSVLSSLYPKQIGIVAVRSNPAGRKTKGKFAPAHEYALFFGKSEWAIPCALEKSEKSLARYPKKDEKGRYAWANFIRSGNNDKRSDRPKLYYPILVDKNDSIRIPKMVWSDGKSEYGLMEKPRDTEVIIYPVQKKERESIEKNWQRGHERVRNELEEYRVRRQQDGTISIDFKTRMDEESLPITWWEHKKYASANYGASELKELFGIKEFNFPKAKRLVCDCIKASGAKDHSVCILDYFAGSGTTGHSVIAMNREDNGRRKYILVEMGDYFEDVLKPRIQKVVYSEDWKNGKPASSDSGISHCFKHIRLESYEDTLNNLTLEDHEPDLIGLPSDVREEYLISYMLDIETRGSLLNMEYFENPFDCTLKIYNRETGEAESKKIDLPETFNYLLGLFVSKIRKKDDFLTIDGKNPAGESVLVIWRNVKEKDNAALEKFVTKTLQINTADTKYKAIYINGDTTLNDPHNFIMLTEEIFHNLMFEQEIL